ncbi:MAG: DUF4197 family protein, partial [Cytophagaceae bacterium]
MISTSIGGRVGSLARFCRQLCAAVARPPRWSSDLPAYVISSFVMLKNFLLAAVLLATGPALAQTKKPATTKKTTVVKKATPAKKTTTTTKTTTATTKAATPVAAPAPAPAPLTQEEATTGLRDALTIGVTKAVQFASEPDGFNLNDDIRIPFPPDAQLVATTLSALPGPVGKQAVEQATNLLNRAAEAAAPQAKAIRAKTAERRAETYQGPKVVPNSKKLG